MINFLTKHYKTIVEIIILSLLIILSFRSCTPTETNNDLLDYKLNQIDNNINDLKKKQQILNDSINSYKNEITKIDEKLGNLKIERTNVNNFFENKEKELKGMTKKQVDSTFKLRYNY